MRRNALPRRRRHPRGLRGRRAAKRLGQLATAGSAKRDAHLHRLARSRGRSAYEHREDRALGFDLAASPHDRRRRQARRASRRSKRQPGEILRRQIQRDGRVRHHRRRQGRLQQRSRGGGRCADRHRRRPTQRRPRRRSRHAAATTRHPLHSRKHHARHLRRCLSHTRRPPRRAG